LGAGVVRLLGSVQNPQTSRSTAFLTRRRAEGKTGKEAIRAARAL
jgi:hypothetical protein